MEKYVVQIIKEDTGEVVTQMEPTGERAAERIERGANINLNHDEYYTEIVTELQAKIESGDA